MLADATPKLRDKNFYEWPWQFRFTVSSPQAFLPSSLHFNFSLSAHRRLFPARVFQLKSKYSRLPAAFLYFCKVAISTVITLGYLLCLIFWLSIVKTLFVFQISDSNLTWQSLYMATSKVINNGDIYLVVTAIVLKLKS